VTDAGNGRVLACPLDAASGRCDGLQGRVGIVAFKIGSTLCEGLCVARDHVDGVALCQQCVADRCDDLLDDADLVLGKGVETLSDRSLDAVLDGDDAAVVLACGDGFDDCGD